MRSPAVVARSRPALVVAVVVALVGAVVVSAAAPADAHASLVRMSPAAGSEVTTAPARVTLTFDENVRAPSTIVVTGPSGRVDDGTTRVVDNTVSVPVTLRAQSADVGAYRVAFRVLSTDGHVVAAEESFRFAPPGVRAAPRHDPATATSGSSVATWWWVGGVALVVALAVVLLLPRRRRPVRPRGGAR